MAALEYRRRALPHHARINRFARHQAAADFFARDEKRFFVFVVVHQVNPADGLVICGETHA